MERTLFSDRDDVVTVDIDTTPLTLRLPRGAVVFPVRGETWLTQDGRYDDVILAPGTRFDVARPDPLVVSATRDRATLHIVRPVGVCDRMARDAYAFARCRAQALRREELSRLGHALSGVVRTTIARLRSAFAARTRLTTQ